MGGEWSASLPGRALTSGKGPPVPIVQESGWAPEPVWTQKLEEEAFRLSRGSNLDGPFVQSVSRRVLTELLLSQVLRGHIKVSENIDDHVGHPYCVCYT
jgi:hypothetical protein